MEKDEKSVGRAMRSRKKSAGLNENPTQVLDIKMFRTLFPQKGILNLKDEFFITELRFDESYKALTYPVKFNGYLALFCIEGEADLEVNLTQFHLHSNSFMVILPGYIIRISNLDELSKDQHFILVAVSKSFMSSVQFDFNQLFSEGMKVLNKPVIVLGEGEKRILNSYLRLAEDVMNSDLEGRSDAIGPLLSSLFHVAGSIWSRSITDAMETSQSPSIRSKMILEQFLKLVSEHHAKHRTMDFYADRMCLTPKYLSKVVKSVSGRSAPDWVDSFVILEAKNMLKYSDMTIKDVVSRLNFPNQSVFYKFFKAHTGMTPSEYRNS